MGRGNESLFAAFKSYDHDGRRTIYGENPLKYSSPKPQNLVCIIGDSGLS